MVSLMARSSRASSVDLAGWCREDCAPHRHITVDLIREKLMAKSATACIMPLHITYEIVLGGVNFVISTPTAKPPNLIPQQIFRLYISPNQSFVVTTVNTSVQVQVFEGNFNIIYTQLCMKSVL